MPSRSIKQRIIRTTVWLTVAVTFLISIFLGLILSNQTQQNQNSYLLKNTQGVADRVSLFLSENTLLVKGLANNKILTDWLKTSDREIDKSGITAWLETLNLENRYSAIYVLDNEGVAIASTDPGFIGQDYSFRPYAQEGLSGRSSFEAAIGTTSYQAGYYFSAPSKDGDNNVIGVLVFKLIPNYLHDVMIQRLEYQSDKVMLADGNGVIIYSNDDNRVYRSFGVFSLETSKKVIADKPYADITIPDLQMPQIQSLIENKVTESSLLTIRDVTDSAKETLVIVPINRYPLYLVIESKVDNFMTLTVMAANIGALIFLAIFLTISILFLIDRFLKRLNTLKVMANNISHGNFDQKNPLTSQDELGELGKAIENMSNKLKNYYADLEQGVGAKTRELEEKTKSVENAKKAITNILEDVQIEKDRSFGLAKDLEKFKLALDNSSDSVIITDSDRKIIYVNIGTKNILDYTPEELLGTKAGQVWGRTMGEDFYSKVWDTVKTEKTPFSSAIKGHRKNNEEYDAQISISPLLGDLGEIEFFVCLIRDTTKEKLVDQAKTEFVSLASHQLRTPLSSINWYAEMLLAGDAGKLNEDQADFVEEIHKGNLRMVDLVNSLLNVSRLELGTFIIEPILTNIVNISKSVLNELAPSATKKQLKISTDYQKDLPEINVDPRLTRIIFQNLLSNAIKYTPEKGNISLKISSDKDQLNISVTDNGYGIPNDQQKEIFRKLFRADNVKAMDTEGTGLGLYMVKTILDNCGGGISFTSTENKGSKFIVSIPMSGMKKKVGSKTLG